MEQNIVKEKNGKRMNEFITGFIVSIIAIIVAFTVSYTVPVIGLNTRTSIVAKADTATNAFNKLQSSKGGVLGTDVENKITNLGSDVQKIILSIVITVLSVTTLWTTTKFTGAGDNAQLKTSLKNSLLFQSLGIAFLASASGFILFGLKNLNLFG